MHWYPVPRDRKTLPHVSFVAHEPWHDPNGPASGMYAGMESFEQGEQHTERYGGASKFPLPTSIYTGKACGTPEQWLGHMRTDRPEDIGNVNCCGIPAAWVSSGGVVESGTSFIVFNRTGIPIPGSACSGMSLSNTLCGRITSVDGDLALPWLNLDISMHCAGNPFVGWSGSITNEGQTFTAVFKVDHIDPVTQKPFWSWESGGCSTSGGTLYGPTCTPLPHVFANSSVDVCCGGPSFPVPNNFDVTLFKRCPTVYVFNSTGGVLEGGRSRFPSEHSFPSSGGVEEGGRSRIMPEQFHSRGGVLEGGRTHFTPYYFHSSGGVEEGGDSSFVFATTDFPSAGGVLVGGESDIEGP